MKARILATIGLVLAACAAAPHVMPKPAAQPRRLGMSISDAGAPLDDAGAVSFYFDGGPIALPFGDPPIDHCTAPNGFYGDFSTGIIQVPITCGPKRVTSTIQLSPAQNLAILNAAKAQAAAQLGVGLQ